MYNYYRALLEWGAGEGDGGGHVALGVLLGRADVYHQVVLVEGEVEHVIRAHFA